MWPLKQDALRLAFEMEEEALGQGMQRIQFLKLKKARNGFSPRTSKGSPALPTPWFWSSEADFRLLAHQLHCINNWLWQSWETNADFFGCFDQKRFLGILIWPKWWWPFDKSQDSGPEEGEREWVLIFWDRNLLVNLGGGPSGEHYCAGVRESRLGGGGGCTLGP